EKEITVLKGEGEAIIEQMHQARSSIEEFQARVESLRQTNRDGKFAELHQGSSELEQNREEIRKLESRVARLRINGPVHGVGKSRKINTFAAVVQPGLQLMQIVPLDEALVVETKIPPHQIGHIAIGQPVKVKVSAYDFARYGVIDGNVQSISATTFSDTNGS